MNKKNIKFISKGKLVIFMMIFIVIGGIFTGCGEVQGNDLEAGDAAVSENNLESANVVGNYYENKSLCSQGDYTYFYRQKDHQILKWKNENGPETAVEVFKNEKPATRYVQEIEVVGNYIYFTAQSDISVGNFQPLTIERVSLDGSEHEILVNDCSASWAYHIVGDNLYYLNISHEQTSASAEEYYTRICIYNLDTNDTGFASCEYLLPKEKSNNKVVPSTTGGDFYVLVDGDNVRTGFSLSGFRTKSIIDREFKLSEPLQDAYDYTVVEWNGEYQESINFAPLMDGSKFIVTKHLPENSFFNNDYFKEYKTYLIDAEQWPTASFGEEMEEFYNSKVFTITEDALFFMRKSGIYFYSLDDASIYQITEDYWDGYLYADVLQYCGGRIYYKYDLLNDYHCYCDIDGNNWSYWGEGWF